MRYNDRLRYLHFFQTALDFCRPLIKGEAVIYLTNGLNDKNVGECRAIDEFLKENPSLRAQEFDTYTPYGRSSWLRR